jgi:AcrR family transcriptional regulator
MARPVRSGAQTSVAIREAAAKLFYERGYEGTSLREVAAEVGLQVGSLYNHIKGKDELLSDIMTSVMLELTGAMDEALSKSAPGAAARLEAALSCHIRYHAEHAREVFIGNSELRSLTKPDRRAVTLKRKAYEDRIHGLIDDLVRETGADVLDPQLQTYALLAMGVHVATWYRPDGPRKLSQIVEVYTRIAMRQLGADEPAKARGRARAAS